jgi:hypothetical protein
MTRPKSVAQLSSSLKVDFGVCSDRRNLKNGELIGRVVAHSRKGVRAMMLCTLAPPECAPGQTWTGTTGTNSNSVQSVSGHADWTVNNGSNGVFADRCSSITLSGGSVSGSGAGNGLYTEDPSSMIEATGVTITWTDFKGVRAWQATGSVGAPPDITLLFGGTVKTNGPRVRRPCGGSCRLKG